MARGVHAGAVSAVAGPGDAGGRELHLERWCGWSGLGGRPTPGRSGCLGGPRGLRVGAAPPVEARSRVGGYLQKIGAPRSSLAGTCGCLGADLLHRPRRCAYAGPGAAGYGANGAARSRQLLCSQIGSGLCAKGQVETEESQMGGPAGREREDVGASRGAGPWLLWPPLTPSPRCWGPQPSPLLPGLRHEAELGPDTIVHLPERPGHSRGGRGQTEAADRGQEASGSLSHQVEKGRCLAHALYGYSLLLTPQAVHEQAVTLYPRLCPFKDNGHHQCCGDQFGGESSCVSSRVTPLLTSLLLAPQGKLEDGTEFDSSLPQNQPFVFSLGTGQVIKGWDQGLLGMCEGEKRKLVIPSELGYGERGAPPKIPGGATLVFEVELLKIERRSEL